MKSISAGCILSTAGPAECLPRALRYLSMERCGYKGLASGNRTVDFRKLPGKMEVLLLKNGWLSGIVILDKTPYTMRIIEINHRSIHKAYVDSAALPPNLKRIAISAELCSVKIVEVSRMKKTDARVFNGVVRGEGRCKRYLELEEMMMQLRQEQLGRVIAEFAQRVNVA